MLKKTFSIDLLFCKCIYIICIGLFAQFLNIKSALFILFLQNTSLHLRRFLDGQLLLQLESYIEVLVLSLEYSL